MPHRTAMQVMALVFTACRGAGTKAVTPPALLYNTVYDVIGMASFTRSHRHHRHTDRPPRRSEDSQRESSPGKPGSTRMLPSPESITACPGPRDASPRGSITFSRFTRSYSLRMTACCPRVRLERTRVPRSAAPPPRRLNRPAPALIVVCIRPTRRLAVVNSCLQGTTNGPDGAGITSHARDPSRNNVNQHIMRQRLPSPRRVGSDFCTGSVKYLPTEARRAPSSRVRTVTCRR